MAYKGSFDPDALPAHAQPDEVAAMMSQNNPHGAPPPRGSSRPDPYATKPQPPPPHHQQNPYGDNGYGGRRPSGSPRPPGASGSYGGPGGQGAPGGSYNNQNRPPPPGRQRWGSPPPQNYGMGPPPQGSHGRPMVPNRPPANPTPQRQNGERDSLWPLFHAVDKDGSGYLTESELSTALVNGDWTSFDMHTVRMMMRMFDTDRSGTINFDEFCGLWGFLLAWRNLFDRFDTDRSGSIQYHEFSEALVAFGYRLSPQFVQLLYRTYDRRGDNSISFDLFVQACISLKRMTDVFKKYDEDRDGYITLSFEEFLTEIVRNR